MLRRLFDCQNQFPRRALRWQTAFHNDQIRSRLARKRQIRFHLRGRSGYIILDREIRRRGSHRRLHGIPRLFAGRERERHGVVVHDDCGNGRAVLPHHVVDLPAIRIALPREIGVVTDHISGNFLDPLGRHRVGKLQERLLRQTIKFLLQLIGEFSVR